MVVKTIFKRLSLIVWVKVVLNRTVVVDSESLSTTTVLFRTTFTQTIKLNLLKIVLTTKGACNGENNSFY